MRGRRSDVIWAGLGLIGLGVSFLLAELAGWSRIWPVFPLLGGLAFWAGYAATGFKEAGFPFVGTAAVLLGLFFFGFSLGFWQWGQMAELWPVFLCIGGVAFLVLFLAERRARDVGVLGVGLAAIAAGAVGLAVTHGYLGRDIVQLWPLLLVLVGLAGLVGGLVQMSRRK